MKNEDGYFNLTHGYFYGSPEDEAAKKATGVFYLSFGKELSQIPAFAEKLKGFTDGKHSVKIYTDSIGGIVNNIFKYGLDAAGNVDIQKGIRMASTIESTSLGADLFKN